MALDIHPYEGESGHTESQNEYGRVIQYMFTYDDKTYVYSESNKKFILFEYDYKCSFRELKGRMTGIDMQEFDELVSLYFFIFKSIDEDVRVRLYGRPIWSLAYHNTKRYPQHILCIPRALIHDMDLVRRVQSCIYYWIHDWSYILWWNKEHCVTKMKHHELL